MTFVEKTSLRGAMGRNILRSSTALWEERRHFDSCTAHGIAWVPYFPLGSAFPGLPKVTEHP
ncbi:hypothetical protein, partial [Streptomyces sp. NPDC055990]|uniref:hypothetical protein n=1 Tax=Streptomyces sp. NPDC055990 TaxID=3345672 RepID=UPI0035D8E70C